MLVLPHVIALSHVFIIQPEYTIKHLGISLREFAVERAFPVKLVFTMQHALYPYKPFLDQDNCNAAYTDVTPTISASVL